MSKSLLFSAQRAVKGALGADTAFTTAVVDWATEQAFPYVVIDDVIETPHDYFGSDGKECVVTLHVWSEHRGGKEVMDIINSAAQILEGAATLTFTASDFTLTYCWYAGGEKVPTPDGVIQHGIARFRIIAQEA